MVDFTGLGNFVDRGCSSREEKFYRDWINKCFMNENQLLSAVREVEQGIDNLKIIHKNKGG